jgi:hypothetical protein
VAGQTTCAVGAVEEASERRQRRLGSNVVQHPLPHHVVKRIGQGVRRCRDRSHVGALGVVLILFFFVVVLFSENVQRRRHPPHTRRAARRQTHWPMVQSQL